MEPRVGYAVVGLFVLVLAGVFLVISLWLVGVGPAGEYRTYAVFPPESVAGIGVESLVKYQGVDVGKVREVAIDPQDPRRVRLLIDVRREVPITGGTTARMASQGLTGLVYFIELQAGEPGGAPLDAEAGAEYPVIRAELSELSRLQRQGMELLGQTEGAAAELRDALVSIRSLLGEDKRAVMGAAIDDAGRAAAGLAKAAETINGHLEGVGPMLDDLAQTAGRLPALAERTDKTLRAVAEAALAVDRAAGRLNEVTADAAPGVAALARDGMPELVALLRDLRGLTGRLDRLVTDLEQDPNLLLYGRPRRPGPGER
jgi:phospholipid/cholesterol/gamma-HCH transport system substrate-binding protein